MNSGVTSLGNYGYCHTETATPDILCQIHDHGYFSIQLEGCPAATFYQNDTRRKTMSSRPGVIDDTCLLLMEARSLT